MRATIHRVEWFNKVKGEILTFRQEISLPCELESRLRALQRYVGGCIDIYHHEGDDIVMNDEWCVLDEPINNWAFARGLQICGTIVQVHGRLP